MGMERLLLMLEALEQLPPAPTADVFVVAISGKPQLAALTAVQALRSAHPELRIVQQLGGGSFRSQMKKADRSGAQVALLWGEDEVAANEVTVKRLRGEASQQRLSLAALTESLPGLLQQQS
jgi:histidyl-tRNA synthetase